MHQFDELAKELAQGVSRREALRRVGGGLAGALLASLGLVKPASAAPVTRASCLTNCGIQANGCRLYCEGLNQYLRFIVTAELLECQGGCSTDACRNACSATAAQYFAEINQENTACGVTCGKQAGACTQACYTLP